MCASPFVVVIYAWRNWIKASQDTLALLVARSGTKRNQPPPSGKQAFRLRQLISLSAGGSKVSCSRFYPISPGSHIYPGTRRDIAALVAVGRSVVEVSTFFSIRGGLYSGKGGGRKAGCEVL